MRLVIVGMPGSVHGARWLSNLTGLGWDIHFFPVLYDPSVPTPAHPLLAGVTYWDPLGTTASRPGRDVVARSPLVRGERTIRGFLGRDADPATILARLIRRLRPDIIHSLEFQHAGYTVLDALEHLGPRCRPIWIATNYGSDIYLFGQLPEHQGRIKALLAAADMHVCECGRDLALGRSLGFTGTEAPLIPCGGGWDLDAAAVYRWPGPTSQRHTIALKSYEGWAGRAGIALEALRRCGTDLAGYTVTLYLASPEFFQRAVRLTADTGAQVEHLGGGAGRSPYEDVLALHGRSRVSIGLSISDAISTSLLEAMMMGAFPIQSNTGCGDEWIRDGVNGILVHPEDPEQVADAIRRALDDDVLVDRASEINCQLVQERLPFAPNREKIIGLYQEALSLRSR